MKKAAILLFPGTNRATDMKFALNCLDFQTDYIFSKQKEIPDDIDLVVLPGGFSYGDYLRTGAMAARSSIMSAVKEFSQKGGSIIGICNGFQILCEAGLLEGALLKNKTGKFICKTTAIQSAYSAQPSLFHIPIAHGEGNFFADDTTLTKLEKNNQIAFRYRDNPNGSRKDIAGIFNEKRNILGMMPHPENHIYAGHDNQDGMTLLKDVIETLSL